MIKKIMFLLFVLSSFANAKSYEFSYSMRTAYEQPNPLDYEWRIGYKNKKQYYYFLTERQNGAYYIGYYWFYKICNNAEFETFYKEANKKQNDSIRLYNVSNKYNIDWKGGFSFTKINWNNFYPMCYLGANYKQCNIKYETDLNYKCLFSIILQTEKILNNKLSLIPRFEYRQNNYDKGIVWAKMIIKYKL